ncbi:dihydroxyacetone kinase Dak1 [Hypoxylon trugodes]|uniref:dihydroxyacetone kinase Dak1 n=1 Tax=Hypoxylon trugodes TaxID=326681 RepID=UPI0021907CD9|nr:dihydroxyacetone kinase Dak1 [Hypoxylon trugodes]KAI1387026.1 dihydroxyacetone kinase Dak1 [Hypoxylon trugodes]
MPGKINSFVSSPRAALDKALTGFLALHPALRWHKDHNVIYRGDKDRQDRVTVLSGGGSGHEPAHAGYVGERMLDAAVCGAVFASPNALQIESGLRLIQSPRGVLIIVKNYTGDKLNFTLAAERFRFASGVPVRIVVVADDVSISRTNSALVGRRGLAGTVLAHKIAGAAAHARLSLDEVADAVEFSLANMATIGVGLDSCSLPGQSHQSRLEPDEIELGIGIHNEPGSKRLKPQPTLEALVGDMLRNILDANDEERGYLKEPPCAADHDIVLLVNNLGGLSMLEMVVITGEVVSQLDTNYRLKPIRLFTGTFLSALNGPGFSITILVLPKNELISPKIIEWLDAPTDALGWTSSISSETWRISPCPSDARSSEPAALEPLEKSYDVPNFACDGVLFTSIVKSIHASLTEAEPEITRMDTIMGDGDCGTTLLDGSNAVVTALDDGRVKVDSISQGMMEVANAISRHMGGTSGALYAVFFTALASAICAEHGRHTMVTATDLAQAAKTALGKLKQVTAAREGDRTMMDALIPFVETLEVAFLDDKAPLEAFGHAVAVANVGCESTSKLKPRFGRSTYVLAEGVNDATQDIPDPGACGVVAIVTGVFEALKVHYSS